MGKILFRGKSVELSCGKIVYGDWIKGFYYNQDSTLYIKDKYVKCPHILVYDSNYSGTPSLGNMGSPRFYTVLPETVGEYIGKTDKNGKKIFEGDIGRYKQTDGAKENGKPIICTGKVIYNAKTASYAVESKDEAGRKYFDYFPIKDFEIIGNLHDNPELLKGGDLNGCNCVAGADQEAGSAD